LNQVADIEVTEGPVQISRENGQRRMGVEINLEGRDIGSFVAEAQEAIRQRVRLPVGYTLQWGGQFENQQAAMRRLALIIPVVLLLILFLLYMTFHELFPALLVLLNLPIALAGGILALWFSGLYLSVSASVGFIVLLGVAVLNGLVLISYTTQLSRDGMSVMEAVRQACNLRLRPILMTAGITVFSLIPMLYAVGPGSEIQKPLAVVVVGGLFTSTISTLLVLPIMYAWLRSPKN
jgi:heavy metal efflux system protein